MVTQRAAAAPQSRRQATNVFVVLMLLYSGLRAAELLDIEISHCPCYHGKPILEVPDGKGGVARSVEIDERLAERINQFVRHWRKGAKPHSSLIASEAGYRRVVVRRQRPRGDQFIARSCRLSYQCLYERIGRIGRAAGLMKLTPHMFRHTFLTRLYNTRQDLRFVQDQAGHADPKTTAIYAQTANVLRREQVRAVPWPAFL